MEIREITQYNSDAPFTGYGVWIVLEFRDRKAHLIHPVHLTELMLTEFDFKKSCGGTLWPINTTGSSFNSGRFLRDFKERIKMYIERKRSFPVQLAARIIAEMDEIELSESLTLIGSMTQSEAGKAVPIVFSKANRAYALGENVDLLKYTGRVRVILEAFKEVDSASIYQISHQVKGKLKTKSELGRVVTYLVHKLAAEGILQIIA